jgi:hypothetical protein
VVTTSETRDGTGAADHDKPYQFGSLSLAGMTLWERIHLTNMRSDIRDYKAGVPGGCADGDLDWVMSTASGIVVPATDLNDMWRDDAEGD